uniref:LPS export ABC transporter periplasmic protein LptC n=1 Tax=Desulfobacca acetoxidans TaxID=60893 RepID=A0A7V4G807_9BACT
MLLPTANGSRPKSRARLGWSLGVLLVLGLVAWGAWTAMSPPPPPPPPAPPPEGKAKMESLSLTEIQDGDKKWILNAEKADYLKSRDEIHLEGVYVEFYNKEQEVVYLRAQSGVVNTKTRGLILTGRVEVEKGDTTIKTELARYLPDQRALVAPEDVTLVGPRVKITGRDLYVDLAKKRFILKQHYLTELLVEKGAL